MAALPPPLSQLSANRSFVPYDNHMSPHSETTIPQLTLFAVWIAAILIWVMERSKRANLLQGIWPASLADGGSKTVEMDTLLEHAAVPANGILPQTGNWDAGQEAATVVSETAVSQTSTTNQAESATGASSGRTSTTTKITLAKQNFSKTIPPPTLEQFLQQIIVLGIIMFYFYLCDYRKIFPEGHKDYDRDTFLFVIFIFFLVGCFCTLRPTGDKILNRDHTEEWKGWMQVMFVWYHYFAAKEWYNWIRVYIACYVWMTGFGNFSFFWVRKDFSVWRAAKMLFRLDFLVIVICLTVSNRYMVYYICAMHTYWFLSVYALMGVLSSWNENRILMAVKLVVYAALNAVVFEVPSVAAMLFRPLSFVLGLADNPVDDLHEWLFRLGLDHWACFVGMLCAYNYPHWEAFVKFLEGEFNSRRYFDLVGPGDLVKIAILGILSAMFGAWFVLVFPLEKYSYNRLHPYTSWIPIIVYIIARNLWPFLRVRHVSLFAWLGKITLETYLSQLHVYLQSNARALITYIPGYPFMNFSLATVIYLTASFQLFHVTTEFSAFLIPTDRKVMVRNIATAGIILLASTGLALSLRYSGVA